ncbi:MAG: hypothetical protein AAF791_02760 [Bacteroidota bacterium]
MTRPALLLVACIATLAASVTPQLVGSKHSDVFHLPDCRHAVRLA